MVENKTNIDVIDMESAEPAGFWIRLLAYVVDFLVLLILVVASMFAKTAAMYILLLVPMVLYKPVLEGVIGGTAGKLALGLRVANADGEKIGIVGGFVRSAIFLLPQIPGTMLKLKMINQGIGSFEVEKLQAFQQSNQLLNYANLGFTALTIISCIVVAFTARKRGLHDMIADTYVVKVNKSHQ